MRRHKLDLQISVAVRFSPVVHEFFRVMSQASATTRLNDTMRTRLRGQYAGLAEQDHGHHGEKADGKHLPDLRDRVNEVRILLVHAVLIATRSY